jgi:hypothetical protein
VWEFQRSLQAEAAGRIEGLAVEVAQNQRGFLRWRLFQDRDAYPTAAPAMQALNVTGLEIHRVTPAPRCRPSQNIDALVVYPTSVKCRLRPSVPED